MTGLFRRTKSIPDNRRTSRLVLLDSSIRESLFYIRLQVVPKVGYVQIEMRLDAQSGAHGHG